MGTIFLVVTVCLYCVCTCTDVCAHMCAHMCMCVSMCMPCEVSKFVDKTDLTQA